MTSTNRTSTRTEVLAPRPSISNTNDRQPTIDDQIRNYRLSNRLRHEVQRRTVSNTRRTGFRRSLESQVDPNAELTISQYQRAQQVPAETLYQAGWTERNHRVYQHYSDERILVTESSQIELPFITDKSYSVLVQEGLQHLHMGMIMVRLHTLHRRSAGVNALFLLRDTRWADDRSVISSMEVDLTAGTQLAYIAPDITISIHDFREHIQLVIQTHGYTGWQGGESNHLLSRSLLGRLSNTSHTNFRYNVQHVADHLASRGIRAIPGQIRTIESLQGQQWIIRPATIATTRNPQTSSIKTRTDGGGGGDEVEVEIGAELRLGGVRLCTHPRNDIMVVPTRDNLLIMGVGTTMLILSWIITLYTLWQMVEMHEMVPEMRFDRYHELAQHVFGENLGLWILVPQQLIVDIGVDIVYMVIGGQSENLSGSFMISYSTIAWITAAEQGKQANVDYGFRSSSTAGTVLKFFSGLGDIAFAYAGHNVVLEIQATIPSTPDKPSKGPMWKGVIVAYIIVALCYFPVALVGYWIFGNEIDDNILITLGKPR
ncbi:lysine histidine transporter 1-like isoform X1 [Canna indica]|uniref:Lysine histidine transporter 1-like isoform X1 n=1 Tax=Canna indica TaxID=4628 RepID=A0AAQ3Q9A7_9LILI|nr:lysine histidine transporter 1-like isoform X1 [Canna indica]